jgi:exosortase D (VPLPA-CTERM-specific)
MHQEYKITLSYENIALYFVYFLLIILIHYSNIYYLISVDWTRNDFDYCILIPFIFIFVIYKRRFEVLNSVSNYSWTGVILILLGSILSIFGELGGEYLISYLSLWLLVFGFFWTIFGTKKIKKMFMPIFLLLTMFPPPTYIYSRITLKMQIISSIFAEKLLHLVHIPAYRDGNIIDIGTSKIQVVAACSGLRYLIPIFVVSFTMVLVMNTKSLVKKIFLILFSIPLAIFMNGLRLALTGYLTREFGSWAIEGMYHDLIGWFVFGISIVSLFVLMCLLDEKETYALIGKKIQICLKRRGGKKFQDKKLIQYIAVIIVAVLYIFLNFQETQQKKFYIDNELSSFPLKIGEWVGVKSTISDNILDALDSTDYALIDYKNESGDKINFYVIYYGNQAKGKSIHSPESCLRGGGWKFLESSQVEIIDDYFVNRSVLSNNKEHLLSYFWFTCRGRNLTNAVELKFYNFWDRLISGRSDGSLVRIITPVTNGKFDDADQRIFNFIRYLKPVLDTYLTDDTQ